MPMNLRQIAESMGSALPEIFLNRAEQIPTGANMDSRLVKPGDVFVCIGGTRVDGHDFAVQAVSAGAMAVIAERDPFAGCEAPVPVLLVKDSIKAIGLWAAAYRAQTKAKVIGITGTAGKTSVKEVLAAVLAVRGATSRNHSNMNNQIGLPLSMLNAGLDDAFWVMEAGISAHHDMDELGAILQPDLAIILNVGMGHLSGLGDKGVAYYKSRFLAWLQKDGLGLVSADYPELARESAAHKRRLLHFSTRRSDVEYSASYLGPASAATGRYNVSLRGGHYEMTAPFRGNFGSENVAAIAGAAHLLGLGPKEIALGLAGAALPKQRFYCSSLFYTGASTNNGACAGNGEWVLIDDSYNANPLSTGRMLETAAEMSRELSRKLVLVMGEMLELGEESEAAHREIGRKMAMADLICWKGGQAEAVEQGLKEAGCKGRFMRVGSADEFREVLRGLGEDEMLTGGVALFKGSRGNRLEELAEVFKEKFKGQPI